MTQPTQPESTASPAPTGGRRKLIAIGIAVVVVLVAVALAVFYYFNQPALCIAAANTTPNTIKLGFTIALTGSLNVEGTNSLHGIETATKWINDHGGVAVAGKSYNITLDYYDDQSLTTQIGPLYTRIIQQDGAQFLLAPYSSSLTTAAAPTADVCNEVMMSHGGSADTIWTQSPRTNLVEVLSPASSYLRGALDWLKANHPNEKIAAIYASDPFSSLATQSAITYAQSLGFSVVYNASYPSTGTTTLTTQLTAAQAAGADDLIGGGHFADGALMMNNLQTVGWTPKFISLLVAVTEPNFKTQLGAAANNVTGPSQWETTVGYSPALALSQGLTWFGPTPAEFTSAYGNQTSGATPSYHSAEAAAAVFVLAKAIEDANSLSTSAVRAKLGSLHLMTFFGTYQINSQGIQTAHQMIVDQWQAGALKVVYPADIAVASVQYPYTGS